LTQGFVQRLVGLKGHDQCEDLVTSRFAFQLQLRQVARSKQWPDHLSLVQRTEIAGGSRSALPTKLRAQQG
jgi:hypothetical protein